MGTFSRSWSLVKASWAVLRSDSELIVFPITALIANIVVMISFAFPAYLSGLFDDSGERGPLGYVLLFAFYVVSALVTFFCNTALVGAALIRLRGGDPTLADGWNIAKSRLPQIIGYALISATVGVVLRTLSERAGFIGRIVISFIGLAWSLATFLVVPILAVEGIGPIDAVKRSSQLLRQTWGEQITGNLSMGFAMVVIALGIVAGGVALIMLAVASGVTALIFAVIALMILAFVALGVIGSALSSIYTAALYEYATRGHTAAFAPEMIQSAFRQK